MFYRIRVVALFIVMYGPVLWISPARAGQNANQLKLLSITLACQNVNLQVNNVNLNGFVI